MNYPEFLEAVCWVAYELNPEEISKLINESDILTNTTTDISSWLDLGNKIIHVIDLLYNTLSDYQKAAIFDEK